MGGSLSGSKKDDLELPKGQPKQRWIQREGPPDTPILTMGSDQDLSNNFFVSHDPFSSNIQADDNFDVIPQRVIHHIMLFQSLLDLVNMMTTCRLFKNVCNTNEFWKSYYENFFVIVNKDEIEEDFESSQINWKKQFFKRYYIGGDGFYRKKFKKYVLQPCNLKPNQENVKQLPEFSSVKIILLGSFGCGKSAFLDRIQFDNFTGNNESTVGARYVSLLFQYDGKTREKEIINVDFWDIGGNRRYWQIWPMYTRSSDCIMVFFSLDCKKELEDMKQVLLSNDLRIQENARTSKIMLIGTKSDFVGHRREVSYKEDLEEYLKLNPSIQYLEVSSKKNWNVFKALGMAIDASIISRNEYYEKHRGEVD